MRPKAEMPEHWAPGHLRAARATVVSTLGRLTLAAGGSITRADWTVYGNHPLTGMICVTAEEQRG